MKKRKKIISTIRRKCFHGDPARFQILAEYIRDDMSEGVKYIADVAGGQGMLARQLQKYNFNVDVIDPRGNTLVGVSSRIEEYEAQMADYYDLVVGLHADEATRDVAESAKVTRTLLIPCCNFWDTERTLGRDDLIAEISAFYQEHHIEYATVEFDFKGPMNIGFVTRPRQ